MALPDVTIHQPQPNGQPAFPLNPEQQEAGLLDILAIVRRRFWLIMFGLVVGVGLGTLYFFKATPMYESKVQILVMPKDSNLPSQSTKGGSDFQQKSAEEDVLATHIELFKSPRVVQKAIETNNLLELATLAKVVAEEGNPVTHIIDNLEVTRGGEGKAKDASVLAATFTGTSADDCAAILDAIVASYQDFLGETFKDTSAKAVDLIAEAKNEIGRELEQKEAAYLEFRATAPLLWKGENSLNIHQERLAKTEAALSEIAVKHTEAKSRLEVIEETMARNEQLELSDIERLALLSANDVERLNLLLSATDKKRDYDWQKYREEDPIRQQTAETEYNRLLTLLLEERKLMEDYGDDNPKLQTIRQQIQLTRDFLAENALFTDHKEEEKDERLKPAELLAAHVGLLRHDLAELEKRRTELEQLARQEEDAAKKMATYEIQDRQKSAEIDRARELYDTVVARLREIGLIKDYGGYLTEIISPVQKAGAPSWPALPIVLALGGICGLFLGSGLAYLVEISDRTFRSPEELHHALRLPIMAHIPGTGIKRKKRVSKNASADSPVIDPSVVAAHKPSSRFAEVFRGLRTALRFSAAGGSDCRVI